MTACIATRDSNVDGNKRNVFDFGQTWPSSEFETPFMGVAAIVPYALWPKWPWAWALIVKAPAMAMQAMGV